MISSQCNQPTTCTTHYTIAPFLAQRIPLLSYHVSPLGPERPASEIFVSAAILFDNAGERNPRLGVAFLESNSAPVSVNSVWPQRPGHRENVQVSNPLARCSRLLYHEHLANHCSCSIESSRSIHASCKLWLGLFPPLTFPDPLFQSEETLAKPFELRDSLFWPTRTYLYTSELQRFDPSTYHGVPSHSSNMNPTKEKMRQARDVVKLYDRVNSLGCSSFWWSWGVFFSLSLTLKLVAAARAAFFVHLVKR